MKHKYKLVIQFESEKPVKLHNQALIQFENGLVYFVSEKINSTYVYGSDKIKLTKKGNKNV